ncbi:MAG: tryptophan--tRNA ligase [Bdellovibrionales bacterium]|nr:tryptophan--tRNA ligase [Bdellovibrionales bacterium]
MAKKTVLSASTTTGDLTLGNFIGAIHNWTQMQEEYSCYYMVADLHSLTVYQDPKELHQRCLSFYAQYLACGLDPQKNVIFLQSHVKEHAELCWALNCITPMGALNRMTQFKEKSQKTREINNGLYSYPVLMAADILLYQADLVPVGEDQKQHLELTRDLAESFNNKYGKAFKIPEPFIGKKGARVMSLQDPTKKMSKSDENPKNFISIIDSPKQITKKIKAAVTDSDPDAKIEYDLKNKEGLANLMTIYSVLSGDSFEKIEKDFEGKMYGHFKVALAELVCSSFQPVQESYAQLMADEAHLVSLMKANAERARERAQITLKDVYSKLGLVL